MTRRPIREMIEVDQPAWPLVTECVRAATNHVEVLPYASDAQRERALFETQATVRSPMGAIVYETGGLLIDHGWVRVLGSGHPRLPRSLPGWNAGRATDAEGRPRGFYLVADDVLGGLFALNGGAFEGSQGEVFYFPPDTLRWEAMDMRYSDLLDFFFSGDLGGFYESRRWEGWEREVAALRGDQGIFVYPPLWTEGEPVGRRQRRRVPAAEQYALGLEWATKLADLPGGAKVEFDIAP